MLILGMQQALAAELNGEERSPLHEKLERDLPLSVEGQILTTLSNAVIAVQTQGYLNGVASERCVLRGDRRTQRHDRVSSQIQREPAISDLAGIRDLVNSLASIHARTGKPVVVPLVDFLP